HLIAFTAFEIFQRENKMLDIYELLRVPEDEITIDIDNLKIELERVRQKLFELRDAEKIQLSNHLEKDVTHILKHGLKNLGVYHSHLPLKKKDKNTIITQNVKLLYFYHNRLSGYDLEKLFK
ncbi:MAG: glycerol-3-phosphate O-acyltransferase, partial [Planctomycetota bacterium]